MRRRVMCFDIEAVPTEFPPRGWWDTGAYRSFYAEAGIRFDCAVVRDGSNGRLVEFGPAESSALVELLAKATELVTFNGLRWDLVALERVCGASRIKRTLWRIPHTDLSGWRGEHSLEGLVRRCLPGREGELLRAKGSSVDNAKHFKIGGCRADVEYLWRVYLMYRESGDETHTLHLSQLRRLSGGR